MSLHGLPAGDAQASALRSDLVGHGGGDLDGEADGFDALDPRCLASLDLPSPPD